MADDVASLQIRILSDQVESATQRLNRLEGQSRKTERAATDLGGAVSRAGGIANGALVAMGASALGLGASIGSAVQEWNKFDKAIKQVNGVTNQTKQQFATMRKEVLGVAQALGIDAKEAAEGLYEAIQAGVPEDKAIDFLRVSGKAAIGSAVETKSAVNSITNVMTAYGLGAERATEISDKLFTTVLYGKASFEQLGASLAGATVPAAALGVTFEEVLAMITQITAQGTSTSEAVTMVERSIQALMDPSEQMVSVFKSIGVETGRQAIANFGLVGTLEAVRAAYSDNEAAMVKALGSVIALQAAQSTTGSKLAQTKTALDQVNNSFGATEKAFAANANTFDRSINTVKASVILLVEQMENNMGAITAFGEALRGIAQIIADISGNGLSDVNNALKFQGEFGVTQQLAQLEKLQTARQQLIDQGAKAGTNSEFTQFFTRGGLRNEDLDRTIADIEKINAALSKTPETTKQLGSLVRDVNNYAKLRNEALAAGNVEDAEKWAAAVRETQAAYEGVKTQVSATTKATQEAAEASKKAKLEEDKKHASTLKAAEAELALQEEQAKENAKLVDMAKDLSTTEREKLQLKQQQISALLLEGKIAPQVGRAALDNLDLEIKALDERNAKRGAGGGAKDAPSTYRYQEAVSGLPEIEDPFQSDSPYEQLRRDEEAITESYERRRLAILTSTQLTEDEKNSLIEESREAYVKNLAKSIEIERQIQLDASKSFFDDLGTIASAFGKKGAKVAKAAAIATTTIDTYTNATKAYQRGLEIPYVGFALGPVFAATAVAAGMANIAKINSTDYSGAYEHGGQIPAGKYGLVGEAGPEFVQGPAMVTSARTTAGMGNSQDSAPQVSLVINNHNGGQVEAREERSPDGKFIQMVVDIAKESVAKDIRRGGNKISKSLETTYFGINRG